MRFTEENSINEFGKLNDCILTTQRYGDITTDDAESLTFFLELVKEALLARSIMNA
jgi:hypothetical protein